MGSLRGWRAIVVAAAVALSGTAAVGAVGAPVLPAPKFGRTIDIGLVSGRVIVRPAGHAAFRLTARDRSVPVGSVLDTTKGEVDLRSAAPPDGSAYPLAALQDGQFRGGAFRVLQRVRQRGLTVLDLRNRHLRDLCPPSPASTAAAGPGSTRILQTLHAHDSGGRFRTRGRYSAGTVRGTTWITQERCDGTLTIVRRGTVSVYDFVTRKTVVVHAGHRYLARAPAR